MLERWIPYGLAEPTNPIFVQQWRRLRWLRSARSIHIYNGVIFCACVAGILIWWAARRETQDVWGWPSLFSVGLMLLSSLAMIFAVIGPLYRQIESKQWELLRLTPQYDDSILAAQDGIAQFRAWPMVGIEIGFRSALILTGVFTTLFSEMETVNGLIGTGAGAIFLLGFGVLCAMESILRMRLLVAASTHIALRASSLVMAFLAGIVAVVLVHLLQLLVLGGTLYAGIQFAIWSSDSFSFFFIFCALPVLLLIMFGVLLRIYSILRGWINTMTLRHAFAPH